MVPGSSLGCFMDVLSAIELWLFFNIGESNVGGLLDIGFVLLWYFLWNSIMVSSASMSLGIAHVWSSGP